MTTREVALLLRCSYSEAGDRMLDGRIKAIRDGHWLRTSRAWVQDYIATKTVKPVEEDVVPVPRWEEGTRPLTVEDQGEASTSIPAEFYNQPEAW